MRDPCLSTSSHLSFSFLYCLQQIEIDMDGTSGALYSIFFNALASGIRSAATSSSTKTATSEVWAKALSSAKDSLYQYTRGAIVFSLIASFYCTSFCLTFLLLQSTQSSNSTIDMYFISSSENAKSNSRRSSRSVRFYFCLQPSRFLGSRQGCSSSCR